MNINGYANGVPITPDLVLETLFQLFPGQEKCVRCLYKSDPQAREIFQSYTECEVNLRHFSEASVPDISRILEYRRMLEESEIEAQEALDHKA